MRPAERAAQARRELDRKYEQANLEPIRARPRSGWIRSVRGALGLTQSALATRLEITRVAVNNLEHSESRGGITIAKLAEVARAMDCSLVYALVPNSTLDEIVFAQARRVAAATLGYASQTMELESQAIQNDQYQEAVDRFAAEIVAKGTQWRNSISSAR